MKRAGGPDPVYIAARHVLLDSLKVVEQHIDSLILVGAQAVYLQTGEAGIAVAPYTTDGDLMIDPASWPMNRVLMKQCGVGVSARKKMLSASGIKPLMWRVLKEISVWTYLCRNHLEGKAAGQRAYHHTDTVPQER